MPRNDPRTPISGQSVNDQILDRMIRHLLYLTGLQTTEANWLKEQFNKDYFPKITEKITIAVSQLVDIASDSTVLNASQLRAIDSLTSELAVIGTTFITATKRSLFARIQDIAINELDFERGLLTKTVPIDINFKVPSTGQINSYLKTQPLDGKPLDEWFDGIDAGTRAKINQQIRLGLLNGEGSDAIVRRIRGRRSTGYTDGVFQTTRNYADSLARSGVIFANDQASRAFYEENSDLISGVMWVVTLDSRTCEICMGLEQGNPYELSKAPGSPAHQRCRCTKVPVVKSWKELGIDLNEAPAGTRASMDGQVPQSLTYEQWLRMQDVSVVEDALGKTKAKLFLDGEVSVSSFTDRRGNILNLDQLRSKESDIFDSLSI